MKKLTFLLIFLNFFLLGIAHGQGLNDSHDVQVKLVPMSTSVVDEIVTMTAFVEVVNPFDHDIKKVEVAVKEAVGFSISQTVFEFDKISAHETVRSSQEVIIQYAAPSQDSSSSDQSLVWDVQYQSSVKEEPPAIGKGETDPAIGHLINEIMFFPDDSKPEWLELHNNTGAAINVSGYHVTNSDGHVYTLPEALPPFPAGAYLLIVFDGRAGGDEDDLSFEGDGLATLHADRTDIFDDKADVCAIFKGIPYKKKTIAGFVAWGDIDKKKKGNSFLRYAKAKKLWTSSEGKIYTQRPKIIGPVSVLKKGDSIVVLKSSGRKPHPTAALARKQEVTFGGANMLPAPQLWLPNDKLETSANVFTFSWLTVGKAKYEIQICRDENCEDIITHEMNLNEPHYTIASPLERYKTYYWRVRSVENNSTSAWSEVRTFTIAFMGESGASEEDTAVVIAQATTNPIGVPSLAARKDSSLLCLDGCDDAHWDVSNEGGAQHAHSTWYCWATGAQILANYRGGSVLKDEIVVTVMGNLSSAAQPSPATPHGVDPEDSLPHGAHAGASIAEAHHALRYALQATQAQLHNHTTKPTHAQLRNYIDNDRPLYYINAGHVMVVDGYRTTGGVFQARFLNTDNNGTIGWRSWDNESFWGALAPDATLTGRNVDPRMQTDSDADGMMDFDEDERFPTSSAYADTEWDGVYDKADIASYTLRGLSADIDGDGLRAEVDPDSDNGGLLDGLEDLDLDGEYEPGNDETDPLNASDDSGANLDLVILMDTTGSMSDDIASAKAAAVEIVNSIAANAGEWRVALASFEDFPVLPYGNPGCGDYMFHDVLNFTDDQTQIINAINSLTLRCGEDWPESHYSALMHVLDKNALGGWRDNVGKSVILISDAPPHDPEPSISGYTAYSANDVIQAAIDLDPAIIYSLVVGGDLAAKTYLEYLSDETGGTIFEAANASEIVDKVIEAVEAVFTAPIAIAGGPYNSCVGGEITFDAGLSYDSNGTIVLYEWDFNGDYVYDLSTTDPSVTHTYSTRYVGPVVLRITDDDGLTDIDIASVEVDDKISPEVDILVPGMGQIVQDGVTFVVEADDNCGIDNVYLTLHATDGTGVIDTIFSEQTAAFNSSTGMWEYYFDSRLVEDGNYQLTASARDNSGNEGYSRDFVFTIKNWATLELLPNTSNNRAGRTMPIKFSIEVSAPGDSQGNFVRNEELTIKIKQGDTILAECHYGITSRDYRIDDAGKLYITNYKTPKKPGLFTVEVWRSRANFLLGVFQFETSRK